jgi:hypothetical protein
MKITVISCRKVSKKMQQENHFEVALNGGV